MNDKALVPCRFCDMPSVEIYRLDKGCFRYPDDHEQALCSQHVLRATPLGEMILIKAFVSTICGQPVPSHLLAPGVPSHGHP
jgi:hypothetical protein